MNIDEQLFVNFKDGTLFNIKHSQGKYIKNDERCKYVAWGFQTGAYCSCTSHCWDSSLCSLQNRDLNPLPQAKGGSTESIRYFMKKTL